jgi:hypothetical protein
VCSVISLAVQTRSCAHWLLVVSRAGSHRNHVAARSRGCLGIQGLVDGAPAAPQCLGDLRGPLAFGPHGQDAWVVQRITPPLDVLALDARTHGYGSTPSRLPLWVLGSSPSKANWGRK